MNRGAFIIFEGGEGGGKDTQIELLRPIFPDVVYTREPGGTEFGKKIRTFLLDDTYSLSPEAEALLFLADRAEHIAKVVEPALARGAHVISNRSFYSLIAYQIYGRNRLDLRQMVDQVHTFLYRNIPPDLIILLDIPPQVGLERKRALGSLNAIESASSEMHERVRDGFLKELKGKPNVLTIDATQSVETVHRAILERLTTMI